MRHNPGPCFLDHIYQTLSVTIVRCLRKDSAFLSEWSQPEFGLDAIPEERSGKNLRPFIMALTREADSVELHLPVWPCPLMPDV